MSNFFSLSFVYFVDWMMILYTAFYLYPLFKFKVTFNLKSLKNLIKITGLDVDKKINYLGVVGTAIYCLYSFNFKNGGLSFREIFLFIEARHWLIGVFGIVFAILLIAARRTEHSVKLKYILTRFLSLNFLTILSCPIVIWDWDSASGLIGLFSKIFGVAVIGIFLRKH